jgi:hypothetical protein
MNQPNLYQANNYVVLPSSTLAIVSLIAGILGFGPLPIIGSLVAIFTGYSARKDTRAIPPRASGDGMATAGIVMGWIQFVLMGVGICCFVAYFLFVVGSISSISRTH